MDWSAMFKARAVVFGCGNVLFGDDGIGPEAVAELAREQGSAQGAGAACPDVAFVDAGTSVRALLADLLLAGAAPRSVVLVDAVMEPGREPGSIREMALPQIAPDRTANSWRLDGALSPHQAPTPLLLAALRDRLGCDARILTVRAAHIPETMRQGLSPEVRAALPELKSAILRLCGENPASQAGASRSQA
jgi:coenzyme F420 hydrogenase subunit delta